MKKLIALLLALVMIVGLVACNKTDAPAADADKPAADTPAKDDEPAKDDAPADEPAEPATINILMMGESNGRWEEHLAETLQPLWLEELNLIVNFEYCAPGSWELAKTKAQAGEDFAWQDHYGNDPTRMAPDTFVAPIDTELLEATAPALTAHRQAMGYGYNTISNGGVAYAVPTAADAPNGGSCQGIAVRNDMLKAVGMDYTDIKTWDDLTQACLKVKEAFPEVTFVAPDIICTNPVTSNGHSAANQTISYPSYAMVNDYDPDDYSVLNWYASDYFRKRIEIMNEWVNLGILDEGCLDGSADSAWGAGTGFLQFGGATYIYDHRLNDLNPDAEVQTVYLADWEDEKPVIYSDTLYPFFLSQEAGTHQEDYFKWFNWIHESVDNWELLTKGVEGTDYTIDEDGQYQMINASPWFDWTVSWWECYPPKVGEADELAKFDEYQSHAIISKLAGFNFDPTPVEEQLMAFEALRSETWKSFNFGFKSVDEWDAELQKWMDAGLQDIVDEFERQFLAFHGK